MVGFYGGDPVDSTAEDAAGTGLIPATAGQSISASVGQGIQQMPSVRIFGDLSGADGVPSSGETARQSPMLQAADANKQFGIPGTLSFTAPVTQDVAQSMFDAHHDDLVRQDVINRSSGALSGIGDFIGRTAPQFADPLNVAAAFVPGLGEARTAAILGDAASPLLARAVEGATQGIVGQAALEPLNYALDKDQHQDWTMGSALSDIAFGGVLGGGLHMLIGGAHAPDADAVSSMIDAAPADRPQAAFDVAPTPEQMANPLSDQMEMAGPQVRDAALRNAIAGVVDDRPNSVSDIVAAMRPDADESFVTGPRYSAPLADGDLGGIPEGIPGVDPGPIRISDGFHADNGAGMGIAHIEAGHGDEIRAAGFGDAQQFVSHVAQNFDEVRTQSNGRLLLTDREPGKSSNALAVELAPQPDGHYEVITAGRFKNSYIDKRKLVWKDAGRASSPDIGGESRFGDADQLPSASPEAGAHSVQIADPDIAPDTEEGNAPPTTRSAALANLAREAQRPDTPDIVQAKQQADVVQRRAPQVGGSDLRQDLGSAQAALQATDEQLQAARGLRDPNAPREPVEEQRAQPFGQQSGSAKEAKPKEIAPEESAFSPEDEAELRSISEMADSDENEAKMYEAAAQCLATRGL